MSSQLLQGLVELDGRDVLDLGCGEGALARRLAGAGARVSAVDPLRAALETARSAGPATGGPRYLQAGAEQLPLPDASFDVAIFFNSLHHVPPASMARALTEAARVLRPGGSLYVQEPLARGTAFELLRPVEDETAIRAAALEALDAAAGGPLLDRVESRELQLTVRHADIGALRARVVSVDPGRAERFDARRAQIQATFEGLGEPSPDGGYEFEQPVRIELFRRLER